MGAQSPCPLGLYAIVTLLAQQLFATDRLLEHSRGVLAALYAWFVKNQKEVLRKSLIDKAIGYAVGQWK